VVTYDGFCWADDRSGESGMHGNTPALLSIKESKIDEVLCRYLSICTKSSRNLSR